MPRLPTSLIRRARAINPLLVPLLKTCRDIRSAGNELRWLREGVDKLLPRRRFPATHAAKRQLLKTWCLERGRGKPLQYLLGTEYFGDLELICRPGVLIPRPETAEIITSLAKRLKKPIESCITAKELRILDLCTGTGCMALLLNTEIQNMKTPSHFSTYTLGVDISKRAIRTANLNLKRLRTQDNLQALKPATSSMISFFRADVLAPPGQAIASADNRSKHNANPAPSITDLMQKSLGISTFDIIIANPPYIPAAAFKTGEVEKSVRLWEPRNALVPPTHSPGNETLLEMLDATSDIFYSRILTISRDFRARIVLMEVGGVEQAHRVQAAAQNMAIWDGVEIWRDGIGDSPSSSSDSFNGQARAVVCWKCKSSDWVNSTLS